MHRAAELLKVAEKHLRKARPDIVRISPAGDFRRGCELVGDLSLVAEVSRKNPLHVYAEVDAALGQRKRQELVTHVRLSTLCPSPRCHQAKAVDFGEAATLSPHLQDDGFVAGD
jgi:hypothetical protein